MSAYRKSIWTHRWWSVRNWLRGYQFGPVQRHRCCDHTTPFHYPGCPKR